MFHVKLLRDDSDQDNVSRETIVGWFAFADRVSRET